MRIPGDLRPNAITARRNAMGAVLDLTVSNPTACGIPYPDGLLDGLAGPGGLVYRPDPKGLLSAREAVGGEYRRLGVEVDPERVVLTASSSEAYGFLFKLLCDPGDRVLVPVPSYPLFEHLAALDAVRAIPYRLDPADGWRPAIEEPLPDRTRVTIAVHPNNPTGSFLDSHAASHLASASARAGAALVVDEVFLDYPLSPGPVPRTFAASGDVLTFTLGGLSKSLGLPQLKLSWIVVSGPDRQVADALERLEFVSDHYLSVSTPVQLALPRLLEGGLPVRRAILDRCRGNLARLREAAARVPAVSVLPPGGGWSAVLRFPSVVGEERLALELLEHDGVAVHPGYFFDFPGEGWLVLSLLQEPPIFEEGVRRVLVRIEHHLRG